MTKFILHGGDTRVSNVDNDIFFKKIGGSIKNNGKILLNYFAKDEHKWNELAKEDEERISRLNKDKNLKFEIANEKNIIEQIKSADVIYFRGGDTFKLVDKLSTIKKFSLLLKDKVVVGSSAGVYVLCKYFYENDENKLGKGLGILNIKAFCHYDESKIDLIKKLDNYKEKLKILLLPSYKHKIIYKKILLN